MKLKIFSLFLLTFLRTRTALVAALPASTCPNCVQREGNQLTLNGKVFKAVGPNIPWLGIEFTGTNGSGAPVASDIQTVLDLASSMSATVIRSHTLGFSSMNDYGVLIGNNGSNIYSEAMFQKIDQAIALVCNTSMKLILPLVDQQYYSPAGGKLDYVARRNLLSNGTLTMIQTNGSSAENLASAQLFYTNQDVVSDFRDYIKTFLTRTNTVLNKQTKDLPCILGWELGNELGGWNKGALNPNDPPPSAAWTQDIADFIRSIDSNHLIVDGPDGVVEDHLNIDSIDIMSRHFYPIDMETMNTEAALCAKANKAYLIGEYDARPNSGPNFTDFYSAIKADLSISGALWWSLKPDGQSESSKLVLAGDDTYSLQYPADASSLLSIANAANNILNLTTLNQFPNV